jgi:SAM-dependent methyltransferase
MNNNFICRSCGSSNGESVLDLGVQPLANNLLEHPDDNEPRYPLELFSCRDCWLLQIGEIVPPIDLFSDYPYFSSFSDTMLAHAKDTADQCMLCLDKDSFVVEIGSNDGYLLKNFQKAGIPCLGIEPAANIAKVSREMGIDTLEKFFSIDTAKKIERKADIILGNNVFAHAPNTNSFTAGMAHLLKPDGQIILEFPYAMDFIVNNQFDTIYHEHVFYFSLTALIPLFARHGLEIIHVEQIPIHGGSLRIHASHRGAFPITDSVESLHRVERLREVNTNDFCSDFSANAWCAREELIALLEGFQWEGKSVAAYGASAKGNTLLNFCGIEADAIDFIVDRTPHKQGKFSPGSHIPICSPEHFRENPPDYTLLLAWNFAEEIMSREQEYLDKGGEFILPYQP